MVAYGIQTECSDWRVHVCVNAGKVYLFQPKHIQPIIHEMILANSPRIKPAFTGGIITAWGVAMPVEEIPRLHWVAADRLIAAAGFAEEQPPSAKAAKAVAVVRQLLHIGWLPLPWCSVEVESKAEQIAGVDLQIHGAHTLQVKCDYRGGAPSDPLGLVTGNLYLQVAECNPYRQV